MNTALTQPGSFDVTQFVWLLMAAFLVAIAARRFALPYTLALVVAGLVLGVPALVHVEPLTPHFLFGLLLPPLLFDAAIHLHTRELKADWKPIGLLSLVGTVLSALVVGALCATLLHLPWSASLVFGALISPTDPVSVIAMLRRLGVNPRLALIIEAESLFNDGVAVVLFVALLATTLGHSFEPLETARQFCSVMLGGLVIGGIIGWLASRIVRRTDDYLLDLMLTTLVAYGSSLVAETLHVSGIIAVVSAGLVFGNDGMARGMRHEARESVEAFWAYAAFMVNSIIFLLIGIEAASVKWWEHLSHVAAALPIVLVARATTVYGLSPILTLLGVEVPVRWRHLLFWGGLRGALCMALALGLPADFPERELVVSMTFGYVLFSLLVQGLTVRPLLDRLGIEHGASR